MEANIVNKIQAFHDTLGEDSKYLTEGEEVSTHQLFGDKLVKKLNDKKTYESEEENQSELEYLKVIRNIRDNNPILFNRIKRLPKKSRSAIKRDCPNNGLITFFRKGQLKKFIHNTGLSVNEVTFFNAISIFENESTHRDALIEKDYYDMLSDNKMFFISILTKEEIAPTGQRGRSNEAYVIGRLKVREFRTFSEFTDEDEDFITLVLRKMLAGEIPQNIIRRIKRKIEKELGSQKVLMILKQEIPDSILTEIRRRYSPESTKSEIILSEYMSKR